MLGVTVFGLLLTPVFFVLVRRLTSRRAANAQANSPTDSPAIGLTPEVHGA
jgi:hypothetical protein